MEKYVKKMLEIVYLRKQNFLVTFLRMMIGYVMKMKKGEYFPLDIKDTNIT